MAVPVPAPAAPAPAGRGAGAVQSVDRAIKLLEVMAGSDCPMGIGEIAAVMGVPQRPGMHRRGH